MSSVACELNVAILIFPDVEELDFTGPYEVFAVASRPEISGEGAASSPRLGCRPE